MSRDKKKAAMPATPLDPWLKMVKGTDKLQLSRIGIKAFAVRKWAERTGTDIVDAALARSLGTSPRALQNVEKQIFPKQKAELYAILKLAQFGGLLDEMATLERRNSRTRWLNNFPLYVKNGFYPWDPSTGYRRPTPGELSGESVRNTRISDDLAKLVAEDPEIEKLLRKFQLRREKQMAERLRETILLVTKDHRGPLQALREKQLAVKKTTFLALLRNPILYGMIRSPYDGELYRAVLGPDKPIISREEYHLLQEELQRQRSSKKARRANAREDIVNALKASDLTFTQIVNATDRDRNTVARALRELKADRRLEKERDYRGSYHLVTP